LSRSERYFASNASFSTAFKVIDPPAPPLRCPVVGQDI
jgi:hypothetical protein